ncbi:Ribose ABC transport system, ATP-binding protein RbsA [Candidatus Rhodobacter oscarellae]|uniref:Ribose ABC transport system, ATP-binding protein RbsA n=1 Tax=Candidatus Rhodobacter oscarellae TaxID=1675527 RepID=A0A0J9EA96_9RHOB|nr:sugar ABC transporter ATP-binding protein [Candidatus Rhodobacter lobularis]KMW59556.1 Ribose ABC transport system, ATP-binding protein RbsA [Candidatus Rhodobacter lobularis]
MSEIACDIKGLRKAFGPNQVLRGINLTLPSGAVTVLMGANGAGKSTLVKVLCGIHQADAGEVSLFGTRFAPANPRDAFRAGIVTVHQSINDGVAPELDVASNLMLDRLPAMSGFFLSDRAIRREARKIAEGMQLGVDVRTPVSALGVADRQMIAIARAMAHEPKVLILDEPTSSLSASEADRLFALIDRLRDTGVAILYISHRMSDIRRIADRIVSMRDGEISGTFEGEALDYEGAVTAMLGHRMTEVDVNVGAQGAPVLQLNGVALSEGGADLTLTAHRSEVVAIAGLLGSGKTKLAAVLFGLTQPAAGAMTLDGAAYAPRSAAEAIRRGVHMCPKDRASNGVIPDFDITNNLTVPFFARHSALSMLSRRRQRRATEAMVDTLGVVCQSAADDILTLSGGNQQKVMVGRWLSQPCKLLVLDEPFQGVDIQARRDIGAHIRATSDQRATIVFVAEIDEALEIADRILVLNEEALVGEHRNENIDLAPLMAQISGQSAAQLGI